jgi:hypothetical protein
MNLILNFCLKLILTLGVIFAIHLFILKSINKPIFDNFIVASYIVNAIMALLIYCTLFFLRKKYLDVLGFIFMAGSFLKFGVYFIFFLPQYRVDGEIIRLEATSFLIPYLTCLIVETFYLVKLLNNKV